jgi:hypothetical protein
MFEPWITMTSALARSCWNDVAPPLPNDVPKLGTVEECHTRLILDLDRAEGRVQLLEEVVLLVVEGRAAEAGDAHAAPERVALVVHVLPRLAPGGDHPVGDHVHRLVERQVLPLGGVRRPVPHLVLPLRTGDQGPCGGALGAQPASRDRRIGITLDLGDLPVLHEDALTAAHRAVWADGPHHLIGRGRAGLHLVGAAGADGVAETQSVRPA